MAHLWAKKRLKKIATKEVVQCLNENWFLGLDVDIALAGIPARYCIARNAPLHT